MQVIAAVTQFVSDHGLEGKPLILWGASSGGTLALKLPGTLAQRAAAAAGEAATAGQVAAQQAVVGPSLKVAGIISGGLSGRMGRAWLHAVSWGLRPAAVAELPGAAQLSKHQELSRNQLAASPSSILVQRWPLPRTLGRLMRRASCW